MAIIDLVMPKMGESIMEATILKWHKKVGDPIALDETLLEIATDKVDSEVPSAVSGKIAEILFKENDVVPVGTVIAKVETNAGNQVDVAPVVQAPPAPQTEMIQETPPYVPNITPAETQVQSTNVIGANRFYSPLVLNIAQSEGIPFSDLEKIPGTGNDGRVTKKDILAYIAQGKNITTPVSVPTPVEKISEPTVPTSEKEESLQLQKNIPGNVEIIEMDRMRKMIAKHMVDSKHTSPHVTSFAEADVTNMVIWRDKVKKEFEKREGTKITFTPLFIDCITRVIKKFPMINSSLVNDQIIIKKDINIGMATALPSGNLIVPVIHNADYLNLVGLSKKVNSLADNARNNKLRPDDTQNGTFTLTNVGTFGSLMGTPIINQPQVAILAVGAIKKRPVVIETELGDTIGIRHMMYLSLSYDHRIVDGSLGASFLTAVAKEFEKWDINLNW
ncbi:MAG: 2-oxo acid dehydrogenase subunit E2 [Bacteroidetes bacterium]|nr:2-oxo acid dehydrogenase subunit E2 [Bacteroidota bacterium]